MKQLTLFDISEQAERPKAARNDIFNDYDGFVKKFEPKKTTDDCCTPSVVYDAVVNFVGTLTDLTGRLIVRPFYPGGDYEHHDYPEGCIVVDTPPFSIYSKIVRFYLFHNIDFFLFAPHLTQIVANADCCYIVTGVDITYENGAVVNTSFTTNLINDIRLWLCPELAKKLADAQKIDKPVLAKNTYPIEFVSTATLGRIISRGIELKIPKTDCAYVRNLDGLRNIGKSVFGGGICYPNGQQRNGQQRNGLQRNGLQRNGQQERP